MAWDTRPIEKELEERLRSGKDDITSIEGEALFAKYVVARQKVVEEILDQIKAIENNLTDHSSDHIANVLDNIYALIGKNSDRISTMELYFLCMIALFHDVGNIHGRNGHYDKRVIYNIYNYVRGDNSEFDEEKELVAEAASKHSGKATDGTEDTLGDLTDKEDTGYWNKGINIRKCAAILRLADELAEGRRRTSEFMLRRHKYDADSEIHHRYANCKRVFISRNDGRISLTYMFKVCLSEPNVWDKLEDLLNYVEKRIVKLNRERLYNKYYAEVLSGFKKVEITMRFEVDGTPVDIGLSQLVINDLGSVWRDDAIELYDGSFKSDRIVEKLKKQSNEQG